jgi:uncharacterized protein
MAKRQFDYGRLVEQALRTVVRDVLARVAHEGLPSAHHFYITFRTTDPGVEIADYLHERYPSEMTIVLQYQYWDLQVDDDGFAVTLSFNNVPERLKIPYTALKVFADPGAEFGLQFTVEPEQRVVSLPSGSGASVPTPAGGTTKLEPAPTEPVLLTAREEAPAGGLGPEERPTAAEVDEATAAQRKGAEIVTLDRFRKR